MISHCKKKKPNNNNKKATKGCVGNEHSRKLKKNNNNLLVTIKVHSVPPQLLNPVLMLFCPVVVAAGVWKLTSCRQKASYHSSCTAWRMLRALSSLDPTSATGFLDLYCYLEEEFALITVLRTCHQGASSLSSHGMERLIWKEDDNFGSVHINVTLEV